MRANTTAEQDLKEAQKRTQANALQFAQRVKVLEDRLQTLCDALLEKGSTLDTLREYHPDYMPPSERLELDRAHLASQPRSAI